MELAVPAATATRSPLGSRQKKSPPAKWFVLEALVANSKVPPWSRSTVSMPLRIVLNTSRTLIALGLTGQFSWQTMQGLSIAQGRHRPRSTNAAPRRIGPSVRELSPSKLFVQTDGSDRCRGTGSGRRQRSSTGSRWSRCGCSTPESKAFPARLQIRRAESHLSGRLRMHWPQRMHRSRNSSSASDPGWTDNARGSNLIRFFLPIASAVRPPALMPATASARGA